MNVLITGDRNWKNSDIIINRMSILPPDTTIIHGGAAGADLMADTTGKFLHLTVIPVKADWELYGRGAGPIRNRVMYNTHTPDLVLAFHDDIARSKGTRDMVRYSLSKRIKSIELFTETEHITDRNIIGKLVGYLEVE